MHKGWHQIAFERELRDPLALVRIGELRLVVVRRPSSVRVFSAVCPHRGANLADGVLQDDQIICPFHGYTIGLGESCPGELRVPEYRSLILGGMLFVLLSPDHDNEFTDTLQELDRTHYFVPGFSVEARVPPELVIENAFDRRHFQTVHQLADDLNLQLSANQPRLLAVRGQMYTGINSWLKLLTTKPMDAVDFFARVFSPNICLTQLSVDGRSFYVVTTATPLGQDRSVIRVSVAGPPAEDGSPPKDEVIRAMLRDSSTALHQDIKIWEGLSLAGKPKYTADDDLVLIYHQFCETFRT